MGNDCMEIYIIGIGCGLKGRCWVDLSIVYGHIGSWDFTVVWYCFNGTVRIALKGYNYM